MELLERFTKFLNQVLLVIAGVFLGAMVGLTCADILFRLVWTPILGSVELVALFGSVVTAFALGYTQLRRGHIWVEVLVNFFPDRLKLVLNVINSLICTAFFALVAWRITLWSGTLLRTGELTETLKIIYYPFSYGVALGCAVLSLVFLTEGLKSVVSRKERKK